MRMPLTALLVIAAALLGETQLSNAQSPYSYPWCATDFGAGGARSCYYASWEQCMTTIFGIGGICVRSPYYHPQPTRPLHGELAKPRHHRHARSRYPVRWTFPRNRAR
jgi:hypothetical protein